MALFFYALAILTSCITAGLYWIGVHDYLFWVYPWYDIPLHMLGGLMIGLWAAGSAAGRKFPSARMVVYVIGIVLLGGSLWELFEFVTGLAGGEPGYIIDTIADLINDTLGAMVAALLYWRLHKKKHLYV